MSVASLARCAASSSGTSPSPGCPRRWCSHWTPASNTCWPPTSYRWRSPPASSRASWRRHWPPGRSTASRRSRHSRPTAPRRQRRVRRDFGSWRGVAAVLLLAATVVIITGDFGQIAMASIALAFVGGSLLCFAFSGPIIGAASAVARLFGAPGDLGGRHHRACAATDVGGHDDGPHRGRHHGRGDRCDGQRRRLHRRVVFLSGRRRRLAEFGSAAGLFDQVVAARHRVEGVGRPRRRPCHSGSDGLRDGRRDQGDVARGRARLESEHLHVDVGEGSRQVARRRGCRTVPRPRSCDGCFRGRQDRAPDPDRSAPSARARTGPLLLRAHRHHRDESGVGADLVPSTRRHRPRGPRETGGGSQRSPGRDPRHRRQGRVRLFGRGAHWQASEAR